MDATDALVLAVHLAATAAMTGHARSRTDGHVFAT
jgi:hypothetical protein